MTAPRIANLVNRELPREVEEISHITIGCAIAVHKELGPGLLESVYEDAIVYELAQAGMSIQRQIEIEVPYKTIVLRGQRLDLVVGGLLIVELKSISQVQEVHRAQLLSYLRAARLPLGLLINFNTTLLKAGLDRIFNERVLGHPLTPLSPSSPSRPSR